MSADTPERDAATAVELMTLMRRLTVEFDRFAERFAAVHGLHRTDLNAVIVITDAVRDGRPLTPGGLGTALNLSAPATTALLNRLEQSGHVERHRSPNDRRKIELAPREQAVTLAGRFLTPLTGHLSTALDRFTDQEREIIRRFLATGIEGAVSAGHHLERRGIRGG
ncbi:MarR family transcriptional regulator [Sphaerisporangium sp. TRM90804]|uniref:MarR family winged helix-turn-helix transcriptional regulator n=1 Tax=Sphaerisporangium sp. TRM90804 TaxID=3031113 RepID=UPI0024494488|nr:MarR family transcriptional regulator [Sphaerisporangium sp. TRM90804]MDH2429396.1 MarR family transcriptional regulator [Sphaerisporangium sp. TRM90804]